MKQALRLPQRLNLLLFESAETGAPLPRTDPRAVHLLDVLRRHEGDTFDAGLVNGPRGKGTLRQIGATALTLDFAWQDQLPPPPTAITLLIGLPRPQTARDMLRDLTTLGVAALHFITSEKADPNYATSRLWTTDEWRRHVLAGAAQAFDTHLPEVTCGRSLACAIAALPSAGTRLALDNYEAAIALANVTPPTLPLTLALGPERGWSAADRDTLRAAGFQLVHLGSRVLRAETAAVVALTLAKQRLGVA